MFTATALYFWNFDKIIRPIYKPIVYKAITIAELMSFIFLEEAIVTIRRERGEGVGGGVRRQGRLKNKNRTQKEVT